MDTIKLFYGYDPRESIGAHVWLQSVLEQSSCPVEAIPLTPNLNRALGLESSGTNSFGRIRFAIPEFCNHRGYAIFCDGADMLLRSDLKDLWDQRSGWHAVQVVKHQYKTQHPRKYVGTELEADNKDYPRKNWSSVMIWNCGHYMNGPNTLKADFVRNVPISELHRFSWLPDDRIGELDPSWNHLVGEQHINPEAKIAHWTLGIPGFTHYAQSEFSNEWREALRKANRGI